VPQTPWQKVFSRFDRPASQLADLLGRHRSKVSRHIRDPKGLISGRDQELIMDAARRAGVKVRPTDMVPERVR